MWEPIKNINTSAVAIGQYLVHPLLVASGGSLESLSPLVLLVSRRWPLTRLLRLTDHAARWWNRKSGDHRRRDEESLPKHASRGEVRVLEVGTDYCAFRTDTVVVDN